nr:pyruvate dehydrogenase E1 component subunit alpha, mitochondrial isoform X2 [Arachis hypogaea]
MYVLISELKLTFVYKIFEMDTYRYYGHSMSDPGSTYRTCDEIFNERQERDPIDRVRKLLLAHDIASEKELKLHVD